MLEKVDLDESMPCEKYSEISKKLKARLSSLQQPVKQGGLPVIILFEGWGASGKGSLISKLILNFDPRGFKVYSVIEPTALEKREPVLWRYWTKVPKRGQMAVFDQSWYYDVYGGCGGVTDAAALRRLEDIKTFERQLTDDGYLIIKFFIHVSKKEQKERFEKLCGDKNTAWRVTELDWQTNRLYGKYCKVFDKMLESTDTPNAPWHVISGTDKKLAAVRIYGITADSIGAALKKLEDKNTAADITKSSIYPGKYNFIHMPKLSDVPLDKKLPEDVYKKELKEKQKILMELHGKIYRKKVPVIIAYEGWDAAGKGGNIRRVAKALDPRGYEVVPIAAPSPDEKARNYLWRFWVNLPRDGHVTIFDRTWYGRVMVERIEGFCSENDWRRAYREINEFERGLYAWGAVIIKFWLQIDKDEQLRRFQQRQNTPSKRWKITDEDWRNREKWDVYENCVNEMIKYTSTDFAPWHIIESQDKKYARVKALDTIINTVMDKFK